jgi:hypothetical protein
MFRDGSLIEWLLLFEVGILSLAHEKREKRTLERGGGGGGGRARRVGWRDGSLPIFLFFLSLF